jgi:hypothetical protein
MTRAELDALYMTRGDLHAIRSDIIALVQKEFASAQRGGRDAKEDGDLPSAAPNNNTPDFSQLRGLESLVPQYAQQRKRRMQFALQSVLHHQVNDPELLSYMYKQLAVTSAQMAHERGLQDEATVLESWKETPPTLKVMDRS